ncbi:ribonuclease Z [Pancytospora epiphaga]|nr:ribonuclease Z [Pancytospora epiphaga]
MQLSYKIFSTVSGKSVIISIDEKRYAFNIFEGFQRYCIEQQFSMCSIDAIFLPDRYSVPGFVGMYLSHGDSAREELEVVSDGHVDIDIIHEFVQRQRITIKTATIYKDRNISVTSVTALNMSNYFIRFRQVSGRFHPERLPPSVPKQLYKVLADGGTVEFEGQVLYGDEFRDKSINLGVLAIIFSTGDFEKLMEHCDDVKTVICADIKAAKYFNEAMIGKDVKVYYIAESTGVDYNGFYKEQVRRNSQDKNFLIPGSLCVQGEPIAERNELEIGYSGGLLKTGDVLEYSRTEGFSVIHGVERTCLHVENHLDDSGIIFLGTGCSQPSKYRNVSAALYRNENSAVLLDCGEDTCGQILRIYGNLRVLRKLRVVFLSHSHADHVLGVAGILKHLRHGISIVGPAKCRRFIEKYYVNDEGNYINHVYIPTDGIKELEETFYDENSITGSRKWVYGDRNDISQFITTVNVNKYYRLFKIGEFELKVVGCVHSVDSTSVVLIDSLAAMSIAYSGDTSPSLLFTVLAFEVDILIHEASFTDDQREHAHDTNHSTDREAIMIFKHSKAKKLILTHFSNRNMYSVSECPCFAADFYSVRFSD